jgi:hypothetical protein
MLIAVIVACTVFLAFGAFIVSLCMAAARPAPSPQIDAKLSLRSEGRLRRLRAIRNPNKIERAS